MRVILMVNSECNVRCGHCYISYSGSICPKEAFGIVKQLQDNGHEVIIAGSETLLDQRYLQAYQQAKQNFLLTNGIILDKDESYYSLLSAHGIGKLIFSIHFGIQDLLKSVPESLVARVLKESKKRGFHTTINTTISSKNYYSIESMCEKAIEYGSEAIEFLRLLPIGRGDKYLNEILNEEQVEYFFKQIIKARKKYPKLSIMPHGNFGPRRGSKGELLAFENRYCPAGKEVIAIGPDYQVYGCPLLMQQKDSIGRYENGKIIINLDLLNGKRDSCIAHLLTK